MLSWRLQHIYHTVHIVQSDRISIWTSHFTLHYIHTSIDSPTIHQLWFLRGDDQKDSIRLIDELTPEWERFGYMLDFDRRGSHMAFIKAQYVREGAMACCNRVLVDWLNGRGTHQPPTWANLISILKDIDECRVLAQRLQTYFGTWNYIGLCEALCNLVSSSGG